MEEERIAGVYNGQCVRGSTIGSGFDVDVFPSRVRIYDVSHKKWGTIDGIEIPDDPEDALSLAIDIASCPSCDWDIVWD